MFWEEKYPQYYAVGAWALTEEEVGDEDMFWWMESKLVPGSSGEKLKKHLGCRSM